MERTEGMSTGAKMKERQESSLQSAEGMQSSDGVCKEHTWPLKLNYSVASCQKGTFLMMYGYHCGTTEVSPHPSFRRAPPQPAGTRGCAHSEGAPVRPAAASLAPQPRPPAPRPAGGRYLYKT